MKLATVSKKPLMTNSDLALRAMQLQQKDTGQVQALRGLQKVVSESFADLFGGIVVGQFRTVQDKK